MTPELKQKLAKIYELVKRGATEGERAAAEKTLHKILAKYNLAGIDLESISKTMHQFTYTTEMEVSLIFRLSRTMVSESLPNVCVIRKYKRVVYELNYMDYVSLSASYEHFRRHTKAQWVKFCAPHLSRCRSTKTRNAKRKQLQGIFFSKYVIASNLYRPEEISTVDLSKMSKDKREEYIRLSKVEGSAYNVQVTNGLLLNESNPLING